MCKFPKFFPTTSISFFEDYVKVIREAADIWAVPLIDLYRTSGLLPELESMKIYVHDAGWDNLHPNASGHERIAKTMMRQIFALEPDFR